MSSGESVGDPRGKAGRGQSVGYTGQFLGLQACFGRNHSCPRFRRSRVDPDCQGTACAVVLGGGVDVQPAGDLLLPPYADWSADVRRHRGWISTEL